LPFGQKLHLFGRALYWWIIGSVLEYLHLTGEVQWLSSPGCGGRAVGSI